MKKQTWIYISTFMACMFLGMSTISAQSYNTGSGYNDDVVIVTNYGDNSYYENDRRRRKRDRRDDRQWRASMLDRAYSIARADGHICKRERRELRKLERELGISNQRRKRRN